MKVVWSRRSLLNREAIFNYIDKDNPPAASRLDAKFVKAAQRLASYPLIGRPGRLTGTREVVVTPNYILVYRLTGDEVGVVTVVHAARQWPPRE